MDGLYPTSYCGKLPTRCVNGQGISVAGGAFASTAYIRNRGETSFVTMPYDEGWEPYLTNNAPASQLYVRVAPSQYDAKKLVFWINGWQQPRLILTRGKKYQFNIVSCGHPFFLTSDAKGGQGNVGNISTVVPSDYFVFTYNISPEVPCEFYYQCANHPGMGGKILVKD